MILTNITQPETPHITDWNRPCLCVHVQYKKWGCVSAPLCVNVYVCTDADESRTVMRKLHSYCERFAFHVWHEIFHYHDIWMPYRHTHTVPVFTVLPSTANLSSLQSSLPFLAFLHLSFPPSLLCLPVLPSPCLWSPLTAVQVYNPLKINFVLPQDAV